MVSFFDYIANNNPQLNLEDEVRIIADYGTPLDNQGYMFVDWSFRIDVVGSYGVELDVKVTKIQNRDGENIDFSDAQIYYEMDTLTRGQSLELICESLYFDDEKLEVITFKFQEYR